MYVDNEPVTREVVRILEEVCQRLFKAYGVELTPAPSSMETTQEVVLCGVLGFAGSHVRGSTLLAATTGPFEESRPTNGVMRDWVGELTNQLVGRLKVKLLERGTEIAVSTPVVLQGEHVAPLPRQVLKPIVFTSKHGLVFVWADVETVEGFALSDGTSDPGMTEGDAVFF